MRFKTLRLGNSAITHGHNLSLLVLNLSVLSALFNFLVLFVEEQHSNNLEFRKKRYTFFERKIIFMKNPLMSFGYFKHHTVQHNGQFSALRIGFIAKSIVALYF